MMDIPVEIDADDPYCDVEVTCVDDVLAWDEPVEDVAYELATVRVQCDTLDEYIGLCGGE